MKPINDSIDHFWSMVLSNCDLSINIAIHSDSNTSSPLRYRCHSNQSNIACLIQTRPLRANVIHRSTNRTELRFRASSPGQGLDGRTIIYFGFQIGVSMAIEIFSEMEIENGRRANGKEIMAEPMRRSGK
jgi:hypothetical protein